MRRNAVAKLRCSNGMGCVAYPALGQPAKLSRGNPGPRCFACEERRVAAELEAAAARSQTARRLEAKAHSCAKPGCGRPAAEWDGGAYICREHAEARRARAVLERRRRSVLTCEGRLRSALASDDERLWRNWARLLREAQARLAEAEEDLEVAESRARSAYAR